MKDTFNGLVDHLLGGNFFLEEAIEMLEKAMIARAMERTKDNQSAAAKLLGIHRNTLQRKLLGYGLGNSRLRPRRKPVASQGRPRKRKTGTA